MALAVKGSLRFSGELRKSAVRLASTAGQYQQNCENYDIVVVGGGIVGVATAREVALRHPSLRMAVVEKESRLAVHQSGNNSGVIHAGIYYKPGTLKAKLCVQGLRLTYKYCDEKKIPYKKVGKLIVATDELELKRLDDLHERGLQNEVPDLQMIEGTQIQEIEPHCRGLKALWSPQTGIVDYTVVTEHLGNDFKEGGGKIYTNFEVSGFGENSSADYPVGVKSKDGKTIFSKYVVTCGGLYSDKLSAFSGCSRSPRIVPFRGEYLKLTPEKQHMIKGNIYPVPDPKFPFLGVHFTPRMDGSIWMGPNAILAFKREGYRWSDVNIPELVDSVSHSGFRKLAMKHLNFGMGEFARAASIKLQMKGLQRFVPELSAADAVRGPAGVRAQALDDEGNLVDDFYFDMGKGPLGKRVLHCRNAPSPAATGSQAIAIMMADKIKEEFQIN